jgi:transcriptional regulator with XRE-family HTH domain
MGFKENLRRLRERAGLTQTEMARKAGVPFRSYQNWEAGSREPRIQALAALARAVEVSLDALISEDGACERVPPRGRSVKATSPPPLAGEQAADRKALGRKRKGK